MNTLFVILFGLIAYTNANNESNSTIDSVTCDIVNKCYQCTQCPQRFDRYDLSVLEEHSTTGWCYKISTRGEYTRGAADANLCHSNGCTWEYVGGASMYVCCCNDRLCNTGVSTSQSIVAVLSITFITTIMGFN